VPELKCFACEREPTQQCPRCGRPYCDEHGEDFCNVCLEPSSGVPSLGLYRGSLVALVFAAIIAIWLIVQPANNTSGSALRTVVVTPTNGPAAGALTTPGPAGTPPAGATPAASSTPAAATSGTPRPAATSTTAAGPTTTGTYVVVSGDTLSSICSDKIRRPASMSVSDCVAQIKSLNGLTSDNINVGDSLKVPQ
jgi:LysM repeat protein